MNGTFPGSVHISRRRILAASIGLVALPDVEINRYT